MKQNVMKEALSRRRGNGVNLTILVGDDDAPNSNDPNKSEVAPEVNDQGAPGHDQVHNTDPKQNMAQDTMLMDQNKSLLPVAPPLRDHNLEDSEMAKKILQGHEQTQDDLTTIGGKARAVARTKLRK